MNMMSLFKKSVMTVSVFLSVMFELSFYPALVQQHPFQNNYPFLKNNDPSNYRKKSHSHGGAGIGLTVSSNIRCEQLDPYGCWL